ncbi:hypothetical protein HWB57_gp051 [Erwinia phage vB_EamM-Bue1]|uniref:Uncharacterized protein n=2 Tax=Nezavisimistyvirus TaxID=2841279 RepID=A0A0A0YR31_9CAUD|nr:hypothetical protein NW77_044 [Erwinia phage phiEa2809]YP_009837650.1 hypothetical protein HWB57_gp051 [Erwinia phage vB_EamM-Bue1]AIX13052.1 hypothetical protein NW77_044 [Erwinia phage phiEa2809]AVO22891.1 hypothetical protein [Erwinia phage vB_EamM-Bue1]
MTDDYYAQRKFFRKNMMLEGLVEQQILLLLMEVNPHFKSELYYQLRLVVHSVEIIDDDFLVAHVEHQLLNPDMRPIGRPQFCQVELEYVFVDLTVFNTSNHGDNDCPDEDLDDVPVDNTEPWETI